MKKKCERGQGARPCNGADRDGYCKTADDCPLFVWDLSDLRYKEKDEPKTRRKQLADTAPKEEAEQETLCEFCREKDIPFIHIPNERKTSAGNMVKLKKQGLSKGFPDNFIPIANKGYHGLFIELKRVVRSVVSAEQKYWLEMLNRNGYKAVVCYGADEAIVELKDYLEGLYSI